MKFELPDFDIPKFISGKTSALIVIGILLILFFSFRGYINSCRALHILEIQVPHITRVAFETQVFALTPANLEPTLARVTEQFAKDEMDNFKKEFESHLWIAVMIRNKGFESATDVLTRVQLTTPITALHGLSSSYVKMKVKEGGGRKRNGISQLELHRARHHGGYPYWCPAGRLWGQTSLFKERDADMGQRFQVIL